VIDNKQTNMYVCQLFFYLETQHDIQLKTTFFTTLIYFLLLFMIITGVSCNKIDNTYNEDPDTNNGIETLVIPSTFDFNTSDEVAFKISVLNNQNQPIGNVRIDIYSDYQESNGHLLASGTTNASGLFTHIHPIPDYYDNIIVATRYLGFPSEVEVPIVNGEVNFTLGGNQKNQFNTRKLFDIKVVFYTL